MMMEEIVDLIVVCCVRVLVIMVLKNRRTRAKVSRKQKKPAPLRIANAITRREVKEVWDKTRSPSDNLSAFGLQADSNHQLKGSEGAHGRKTKPKVPSDEYAAFVGMGEVPRSDFTEANPKRRLLSEEKQLYAVQNINKYREDYEAMKWDTETNPKQFTESQMKRLIKQYLSLSKEEILVEI